jgi:hypothetical protein
MRARGKKLALLGMLAALAALALLWRPINHMKAEVQADTHGVRLTLEFATQAFEQVRSDLR